MSSIASKYTSIVSKSLYKSFSSSRNTLKLPNPLLTQTRVSRYPTPYHNNAIKDVKLFHTTKSMRIVSDPSSISSNGPTNSSIMTRKRIPISQSVDRVDANSNIRQANTNKNEMKRKAAARIFEDTYSIPVRSKPLDKMTHEDLRRVNQHRNPIQLHEFNPVLGPKMPRGNSSSDPFRHQ